MRICKNLCLFIYLTTLASTASAADIVQAYTDALAYDATFKAAEAQWLAEKELIAMSRAVLLPTVTTTAGASRAYRRQTVSRRLHVFSQNNKQFSLTATQTLFDYQAFAALKNASATVKQARANYNAARQVLIMQLANAYLEVLQAYDHYRATCAQKQSLKSQLNQSQKRYRAGIGSIVDVDQVQASYDAILAEAIVDKNMISDKCEALQTITGHLYPHISGLKSSLPFIYPIPKDASIWARFSGKQNYAVQAARFGELAARANVRMQRAGHLPVVHATGGYTYNNASAAQTGLGNPSPQNTQVASIGVTVSLPIYQGGLISIQTRQAAHLYAEASAQTEVAYRNAVMTARKSYRGVISGIAKLKADKQALISNRTALQSAQAGYKVGKNTIVDVLQQEAALYTARTTYADDQYHYILSLFTLKQAAGILSRQDLIQSNRWFTKTIYLSAL